MTKREAVKGTMVLIVLLFVLGIVGGMERAEAHETERTRKVPACAEDEMLDGVGNFGNGRWDKYVCVHPEDVAASQIEHHYKDPTINATVAGSVCEHPKFWERTQGITIMPEACDGG